MPEQALPLWSISVVLVVMLALAAAFGGTARWLFRGRARLSMTSSIVMSLLGSAFGFGLAWLIRPDSNVSSPLAIVLAFLGSLMAVMAYASVAAHFQKPLRISTQDLLRAGETDLVEFKSTARVNMHTGQKDPKMEQVIAKTLAAFLNSDGGTLLVGVDDFGTPLGLDADLATMKKPDHDRYELWLRDWLVQSLGPNAAGLVQVDFESIGDDSGAPRDVLHLGAPKSAHPVYMRPQKNMDTQFWVRTGNSTRHLPVDAAAEYTANSWPLTVGAAISAQLRASVRFSGGR